jgi:hypothetical protein
LQERESTHGRGAKQVKPLGHRSDNGRLDRLPVVHDLVIVEPQDGISKGDEAGILREVAAATRWIGVRPEPIELQDKPIPHETVNRVPVDDHLLPHLNPATAEPNVRESFDS